MTYIPPGFTPFKDLKKREVNSLVLRDRLSSGALSAFYLVNGDLKAVKKSEWISPKGKTMINLCVWSTRFATNSRKGGKRRMLLIQGEEANSQPPKTELAPVNPGGRPPQNYDRMWRKVVTIANTPDGLPPDRPTLIRLLQDWMAETNQHVLSESTLISKLRPIYQGEDT